MQSVVARATLQDVDSGTAVELIVAAPSSEPIAAWAADQLVGAIAAEKKVVAGPAVHRDWNLNRGGHRHRVVPGTGDKLEAGHKRGLADQLVGVFGLVLADRATDFQRHRRV